MDFYECGVQLARATLREHIGAEKQVQLLQALQLQQVLGCRGTEEDPTAEGEKMEGSPVSAPYPYPSPGFVSRRKKRAGNWSPEETMVLIQLWRTHLFDLRSAKRNSHVYHSMADKMAKLGFLRLPAEVRNKILNLTADYRKEKVKSETTNSPSSWKYWNEVKEVMESLSLQEAGMKDFRSPGDFSLDHHSDLMRSMTSPAPSMGSDGGSSSLKSYSNEPEHHPGDMLVTSLREGSVSINHQAEHSATAGYAKGAMSVNKHGTSAANSGEYHGEYLQIIRALIEEQRRSNQAAEEAERQTLELMRQQLYLKQQSLILQNRIVTILERLAQDTERNNGAEETNEEVNHDVKQEEEEEEDDDDEEEEEDERGNGVNEDGYHHQHQHQPSENGQMYLDDNMSDSSSSDSSHQGETK